MNKDHNKARVQQLSVGDVDVFGMTSRVPDAGCSIKKRCGSVRCLQGLLLRSWIKHLKWLTYAMPGRTKRKQPP